MLTFCLISRVSEQKADDKFKFFNRIVSCSWLWLFPANAYTKLPINDFFATQNEQAVAKTNDTNLNTSLDPTTILD